MKRKTQYCWKNQVIQEPCPPLPCTRPTPTLPKHPYLFFKGGLPSLNGPDSCFSFSFQPYLKLKRVTLISTSNFTSRFWLKARVELLEQGEGIYSAPGSIASLGRVGSQKSWGFSKFAGAGILRNSTSRQPPTLLPSAPSCSPPAVDQLLDIETIPQGL